MMWAYIIGTFCGMIATMNPSAANFRNTIDDLNRFMKLQDLEPEMRRRLREYLHPTRTLALATAPRALALASRLEPCSRLPYPGSSSRTPCCATALARYFHQTKHLQIALANRKLLARMSPSLAGEVAVKTSERWLKRIWFLQNVDAGFMAQLAMRLEPMVFAPAELAPVGKLYICHRGVALYGGKLLTAGRVWGEDMILESVHLIRPYSARAMNYLECYSITKDDLLTVAANFPGMLRHTRNCAYAAEPLTHTSDRSPSPADRRARRRSRALWPPRPPGTQDPAGAHPRGGPPRPREAGPRRPRERRSAPPLQPGLLRRRARDGGLDGHPRGPRRQVRRGRRAHGRRRPRRRGSDKRRRAAPARGLFGRPGPRASPCRLDDRTRPPLIAALPSWAGSRYPENSRTSQRALPAPPPHRTGTPLPRG